MNLFRPHSKQSFIKFEGQHRINKLDMLSYGLSFAFLMMICTNSHAAVSQTPLFLTIAGKPNTLVILDNSNSMDEDAAGTAVGGNSAASKSQIARSVIKNLITDYTDRINLGLMTYKLPAVASRYLHNSPYDVSYNPANYDPTFVGARASSTKKFRLANPTSLGNFIHYNVALPFYSTANEGNAFCYSPTANAFNNGETATGGPWDTYRCFQTKTGTSDTLPTWNNSASEAAQGYATLRGQYTFSPTDSDLAQGILDFGKQNTWHYVSTTWFANSSPGRGYLNIPIRALDSTHAASLNTILACNIPGTPAPCTASGIQNAGLTPIEGTLLTAKDYFGGAWTVASEGYLATGANKSYPLPNSCNKNFVILLSDGLPSTTKTGTIITDPAASIAAAAAAAASLNAAGIETYVIGFALPYGIDPHTLDTIAVSGGTNQAYSATDFETLTKVLNKIFQDILSKSNSASSIASNSARLDSGTRVYQAKFDATDWSGQLISYSVNTTTGNLTEVWEASSLLPSHGARNIYTYNPLAAAGLHGVPFTWDNLTTTPVGASQQSYLNTDGKGSLRVDWLRGDDSQEENNPGGIFRDRTNNLGDIVNSDPVYVGDQDYGYSALPGSEGDSYSSFLTTTASRRDMIYVGANDGMLHGFDASDGQEILAYIPNAVFPELIKLSSPSYIHRFYVDGLSHASDVYYDSTWHTVVTGGTGAGGRGIFTLDVTNPDGFGAASPLWEFTSQDDADLGYTLAQPTIARMQDGNWAVIVANGYESNNGHAVLFFLDVKTGAVLKKIDTGVGDTTTKNGLSSPIAVDTNNDRSVDTIYAGDLYGNLWKFDVSGNIGSWTIPGATPFFVACTTSGPTCAVANRQPITAKPNVGSVGKVGTDQNGVGRMVYFGTGKYFEATDQIVTDPPQVQTFYGLWDQGSAITDRDLLQEQTIIYEGNASTVNGVTSPYQLRLVSKNPVCYGPNNDGCTTTSPLKSGWALNLISPIYGAAGERSVSFPLVRNGLVIFPTLFPEANPCGFGGKSWLMEVDALNGSEYSGAPFDVNGDGKVDSSDQLDINGEKHYAAGLNLDIGIIKTPAVVEHNELNREYKYVSGSSGKMNTDNGNAPVVEPNGGGGGNPTGACTGPGCNRKSWRQLR